MQTDKPTFRTSMGGYNKQDVNEYIASLSESFEHQKTEYEKKIAQISVISEELQEKVDSFTKSDSGENTSNELYMANSLIAEQQQTLEKRLDELKEKDMKLAEYDEKIASLEAELEKFKESEEKLSEYDRMSKKMGEILIKAASSAEQITAEAEKKAADILRSSEEKTRELSSQAKEMSENLDKRYANAVAAINKKLTELVNEGFDTLNNSMKSADEELAVMLENRRLAAKAAVLRTAESLPELEALAELGSAK